ncbi:MAG TPA: hypothetical protein VKB46_27170 [Pyrinomonadaceae bacterium]|nr:hypothetical protein [Pyrinomonadaceae bacterium]
MTIEELLDLVVDTRETFDEGFAAEFQSKAASVCSTRAALNQAGFAEPEAATDFINSWSDILAYFADDPASLAAFTAPEVAISQGQMCAGDLSDVFPVSTAGTPTTTKLFLFQLAPSAPESMAKLGVGKAPKVTAKPKPKPKPKPKAKAKPKAKPKAAKKKPKAKLNAKGKSKKKATKR